MRFCQERGRAQSQKYGSPSPLLGPPKLRIFVAKMAERRVKESHPSIYVSVWDFSCKPDGLTGGWTEKNPLSRPATRE